jgi:predicted PurR-regulated permease PerM
MTSNKVEISQKTIVFTVLFLISLWLVWYIHGIILLFFVCVLLMETINPVITRMERLKIPRLLSVSVIYLIVLAILFFAFAGIIPVLVEQTTGLIKTLPSIIQHTKFFGLSAIDLSSQFKILEPLPGDITNLAVSVLSNIIYAIVIIMITFYLLLERKHFNRHFKNYFGEKVGSKITKVIDQLEVRFGSWINAQLIVMLIIGILSYVIYLILGLKYAVSLAIIAGLLEIIPNVGAIIAIAFAAIIGLNTSFSMALLVVAFCTTLHLIVNNIIVPKILKETCNINPVVTILLLVVGAKLGGVVGVILAVPIYMTIEVIYKVLSNKDP